MRIAFGERGWIWLIWSHWVDDGGPPNRCWVLQSARKVLHFLDLRKRGLSFPLGIPLQIAKNLSRRQCCVFICGLQCSTALGKPLEGVSDPMDLCPPL